MLIDLMKTLKRIIKMGVDLKSIMLARIGSWVGNHILDDRKPAKKIKGVQATNLKKIKNLFHD